ncbi:ArnT family glycosyltransferase [Leifsonia sp. EB34]|uniref:ArnT family glycosyltransferase n=1 Tax=Leifsonia sp. EB34 TaxID=3156303 RepID=UPI003512EEAF
MAATREGATAIARSTKRSSAARRHVTVLLCILSATAILYSWNLATSGYSDYYSTAAKSMSVSWKAFFFGAFDPQSTITLDKLSGFLIPQALSARIFGFSSWSIALPQVLEGLVTVAAAYYVFSRWSGRLGAAVGALSLASAPLMISMFSHGMEDALLTMWTTLAIAAWQRAIDSERMGWLLGAGILVGLGFQAKMAQAWLVLPALCVGYVWMSHRPRTVKLRDVTWCLIATIVVSLSWMTAMTLIPSAQRPYFDGSIDNNIFSTVLGYNGINRFFSNAVPGALPGDPLFHPAGNAAIVGAVPGTIAHTPFKFFLPQYATQIGWFFPVAAAGLILGIAWVRTHRWPDMQRNLKAGLAMCSLLLISVGGVLSAMSLPHTAYLAAVMLPVAGLTGIGATLLIRAYRQETRWRLALPVAVGVQTVWCLVLLRSFPAFAAFLTAPVAALGSLGTVALAFHAFRPERIRRLLGVASILAVLGAALTPTVWTLSTLNPAFAGTADDAYGGPQVAAVAARKLVRHAAYGIGLDSNRSIQPTESIEASAFAYAQHRTSDQWALATDSWRSAAPMILRGQTRVLPIGGFTSRAPSPTAAQFRELVAAGRVRFVLLSPAEARTGVYHPNLDALTGWTMGHCQIVSPDLYLTAQLRAAAAGVTWDTLYDCDA